MGRIDSIDLVFEFVNGGHRQDLSPTDEILPLLLPSVLDFLSVRLCGSTVRVGLA